MRTSNAGEMREEAGLSRKLKDEAAAWCKRRLARPRFSTGAVQVERKERRQLALRRSGRFPDNEFRSEYDVPDVGRAGLDGVDEHACGATTHFPMFYAHRRKRRRNDVHERHVVVPDDRNIIGAPQIASLQCIESAEGQQIVSGDDRRDIVSGIKNPCRSLRSSLTGIGRRFEHGACQFTM